MNDALPGNSPSSPAIVVAAYNRPASLLRLLQGLTKAHFPDQPIPLHISIDQSHASDVARTAEAFDWPHGPKVVEQHEKHLGLREHLLHCGDLSERYGAIILLEDDLYVSTEFYRFAKGALKAYREEARIAGVSLYHYEVAESSQLPFRPLEDGNDLYFMQWPSSWGFAMDASRWLAFRDWLKKVDYEVGEWLPQYVQAWETGSWKRLLVAYLRANDQLFAYPRVALSTHFGEPGPHTVLKGYQHSPLLSSEKEWKWVMPENGLAVYDAWFELTPDRLQQLQPDLAGFALTVDLYGMKEQAAIDGEFILTSRWVDAGLQEQPEIVPRHYAMELLPVVQNVVAHLDGYDLFLVRKDHLSPEPSTVQQYIGKLSGWSRSLIRQGIAGDLLRISIVVPESSHSPAAEATIASVLRQRKVQVEVIALVADALEPSPDDRVRVLEWPAGASYWQAMETGLRACSGDLVLWLHPGWILEEGFLEQVEAIFRQYREVDWLLTRPDEGTSAAWQRWTQDRFGRAGVQELQRAFGPGACVWRRGLLRSFAGPVTGVEPLLKHAFSKGLPYTADLLGASREARAPSLEEIWGAAADGKQELRAKRTLAGRWLSKLTRPFFLGNGALRWIHQEIEHYPPVIRYDQELDRWDMKRF